VNQPPYPHSSGQPDPEQQAATPGCWWHPNRPTALSCARCGRPACPDCLREAAVGFQCTDCVQTGQRQQRTQEKQYRAAGLGVTTIAGTRPLDKAVVTPILIGVNVAIYLITAVLAKSPWDNERSTLFNDWVLFPPSVGLNGEWWRLLTSGFLHLGPIHIAVNMLSLWMIGRDLERLLGKVRFLAVYFIAMLGGGAAVYLFADPGTATAGASGALYGLLGALLVAVLRLKLNPGTVIGTIVLNLALTYAIPGISVFAHLGGLVTGVVAMVAIVYAPAKNRVAWQAGMLVVVLVAAIGLVFVRNAEFSQLTCTQESTGAVTCVSDR
jgi:membrane associated rhomboid family serine protease